MPYSEASQDSERCTAGTPHQTRYVDQTPFRKALCEEFWRLHVVRWRHYLFIASAGLAFGWFMAFALKALGVHR
jgi:hypothetical protein